MTWIGANMRAADRHEVLCQCPAGVTGSQAMAAIWRAAAEDWAWVAFVDQQPACAFGFQALTAPVWIGWAIGTDAMIRAIPAVTRHCWAQEARLLGLGVRRVEVRTMTGHDVAQRWLVKLGARHVAALPDHGRDGEQFELYAWTLADGRPSERTDYRVPTLDAQGSEAIAGADQRRG